MSESLPSLISDASVERARFSGPLRRRWLVAILAVVLLSLATKLIIARNTYGSLDSFLWENNLHQLRQDGALELYRTGTVIRVPGLPDHHEVFNHPPFMIWMLKAWGWLADVTGLPLRFWLRATCSLSDVAGLIVVALLMFQSRFSFRPENLFLTVASPVSLMISGFHGNVDPLMIALVLVSVYLLQSGRWRFAGVALGLAISIKIVPLIFVPAFFLYQTGRKRNEFFLWALATFLTVSLPFIVEEPWLICRQVFGYSPQLVSGRWGISRFIYVLCSDKFFEIYTQTAKIPVLGILALVSFWMNAREKKPPLELQCGLVALVFVALIPGFGVQYLVWLVPWVAFLPLRQALAFHVTAGVLLFSYYNRSSNGLPWFLAYNGASEWYGAVVFLGLLCWLTICCLAIASARRLGDDGPSWGSLRGYVFGRRRVLDTLSGEAH